MFRVFGLIGLLIALLLVGVLIKHQWGAQHGLGPVQAASSAQAHQLEQQVQDDVNKAMQDRSKQLDQAMEHTAP